ncbi:Sodium/hydrogen exchanger family-domain-containing protein [Dunaliella salina]|uniref:Sodium/hydrogen exchanger family-domain-containing protein n=1 Tax=Dunaliella salina TaxID=3046 RepID=A0ABQ7G6F9_DUNSA|nr:Sodium/hydrogen exchanger family-domain-containing protein [Dunaliella salina]|eukprot:KAF5830173.1 Sodium/hydrogen exchanger family-domain-containing protein [Dunaliella salina]
MLQPQSWGVTQLGAGRGGSSSISSSCHRGARSCAGVQRGASLRYSPLFSAQHLRPQQQLQQQPRHQQQQLSRRQRKFVSRHEASSGNAAGSANDGSSGQGTAPTAQAGSGNNSGPSSINPLSSMDEARAAAYALGPIELEQDSSARPLKEALIDAQARFQEKAQLREALEAEAQEVAQQQHADTVARLQEKLLQAQDPGIQAVVAETSTIKADSIAAAAMKAAETAVMEEMQAAAVVKETHQALEKALSQLSTLSSAEQKAQAVAAMKEGMTPQQADQLALAMSSKESKGAKEAKASKEADPAKSKAEAEAAAARKREEQMAVAAKVGFVAVLAACAWWALQNTTPGLQLLGWGQDMYHVAAEKFSSIICVPLVVKLVPGGNPVLGYLLGGAIVGPHALGLIQDVQSVKHLAELGVVFLLFNIGLELSLDRLQSMAKYVFGLGSAQVALTLLGIAGAAVTLTNLSGPSAIILGGSLALSSTAVAIQVLEDRGEMGSRHGRLAKIMQALGGFNSKSMA